MDPEQEYRKITSKVNLDTISENEMVILGTVIDRILNLDPKAEELAQFYGRLEDDLGEDKYLHLMLDILPAVRHTPINKEISDFLKVTEGIL